MLTRIYIDNFRCFANFEFRPQAKQLILGVNGTGKSALLDVLGRLRDFAVVTGRRFRTYELFTPETRTRWQNLPRQTFELEITGNGGTYRYTLWVEGQDGRPRSRVVKEALDFDEKPLLLFDGDQVHLFDDNHVKKHNYPFDADRSALATGTRRVSSKLAWFKEWLDSLYCLRVDPYSMGAETKESEEEDYLEDDLSNFAGWYGHIVQEKMAPVLDLQRSLREVIEGLDSLDLKKVGRTARVLRAVFLKSPTDGGSGSKNARLEFDFDELSDGQKALIALYTLLYCAIEPGTCICIDEPDNFVALAEIQPWLLALKDRVDDAGAQVILVSHHPEVIDLLAPEHGVVFSRAGIGPVQVKPYRPDGIGKLTPSEHIARGWERG